MISKLLRRTEAWAGPAYWWGRIGLSAHPAYQALVILNIALIPVLIVGGWMVLLVIAGPLPATGWALEMLRKVPYVVQDFLRGGN